MINIVICDDEIVFINEISDLILSNFQNYKYNIFSFNNGQSLLDIIHNLRIDILFMDIELGDSNGINITKKIKQINPSAIVFFITNYYNYVAETFRIDTFQFIKKPIEESDFIYDFNRAIQKYKDIHKKLEIHVKNGIKNIFINDIYYIEIYGRSINIILKKEMININGKLSYYESLLCNLNFIRVHKSYIINLDKVEAFTSNSIKLFDIPKTIPLSRNYKRIFKERYKSLLANRYI